MTSLKSSFTPISRFGIGILSCFMVCDSMEVSTRRIKDHFECHKALNISIEGYESLFVISDSDQKEPGTETILTLRTVHPWERMKEEDFVKCVRNIVPNPAVDIEITTDQNNLIHSSDYFDKLDLDPLLDYTWSNKNNIKKIDIDLTNENYGFKGKGCIGLLIKNEIPVNEVNILSKDVIIDGETYTLSSNINYDINYITEKSTNISVDEDGIIITDTSFNRRFQSKSSLSIHGIEVPCKLFSDFGNMSSKTVLKTPFPISFRLDIGQNNDLNLNSARDQIIYDDTWLTFEEDFYKVVCSQLKSIVGDSDWQKFKSLIKENVTEVFYRIAENI